MSCGEQVVVRETQASCGNGSIEAGEACDDGNQINTDGCTLACTMATCGDGTMRTDLMPADEVYEACDDGNDNDEDGCTTTCLEHVCGDGLVRRD